MNKNENNEIKRIRVLKLWEMLLQNTDAEHPMSTPEILQRLKNKGIDCVRQTFYADIALLQKYGYDVVCVNDMGRCNLYYVEDRSFSIPEVQILMNAVQAASFITERKTGELMDKYGNVAQYRVDRMNRERVLDEKITPSKVVEGFDLAKHKKQLFDMYGGEETTVTLQARNAPKILDVLFDTFGEEITLRTINETTVEFAAKVQVSPTFIAWCCSLGDNLNVVAPMDVVNMTKEYLSAVLRQYEKQ